MSKKKNSFSGLVKNLVKSIGSSLDDAIKYINKHPIRLRGENKGHKVYAKIGGEVDKETKAFLKSGKKFKISKNTMVEI